MNALKKHDAEIAATLNALVKAFNNNSWLKVYDLTKYLNRLINERKQYIKYQKNAKGELSWMQKSL